MSTASGGGFGDVPEILSEGVMKQLPAVNEVAIAAADSYYAGEGWASIAVTTLVIRSCTVPLLVNQLKATSKLTIMKPQLEELKEEMESKGMDLDARLEYQKKVKRLFKEHGCSPLTPLKGLFIQAPIFISFFLAILNIAENVPSFKEGGTSWFVDLSTPDPMYIFPIMAGLSFLITVEVAFLQPNYLFPYVVFDEIMRCLGPSIMIINMMRFKRMCRICNLQEGMEGNPAAKTMKNVSRGMAVLTVPFTMSFPKAVFCYWITSNVFSLGYGFVVKNPVVKKILGLPDTPPPPPPKPGLQQSAFSLFSQMKQLAATAESSTSTVQPAKTTSPSWWWSSTILVPPLVNANDKRLSYVAH